MQNLHEKINELADLRTDFELLKANFEAEHRELKQKISDLEAEIREEILKKGETVSTEKMSAIWVKGRVSWDGKLLEGYSLAHPDILQARKIGEPTVSFRPVKK